MDFEPVVKAGSQLGHSWGPTAHWWMSLTAADQGAWVSGLGAFAAAFTAVWIADRDRRARKRERHELARVATAFVYMDVQQIATFGIKLHSFLLELSQVRNGQPFAALVVNINTCTERVKAMSERTSLERINAIPTEAGIALCRAVGSLPFICDTIEKTMTKLQLMASKLDDERNGLVRHALTLGIPLRGLISYFEWFGVAFPEDKKEASDATVHAILKQVSPETYQNAKAT